MSIYPEIVAGFDAARQILAEHAVSIKPLGPSRIPTDPIDMLRSGPRAYSVEAIALREGINMCRNGRFGFDEEWLLVKYPVPHTDPEFTERLREVLLPAVEGLLFRTMEQSNVERAALKPGEPVEAWEAVRKVGGS